MFEKVVVIDGRGHLVGRLASTIAKELLNGQKIVVVRAEELEMSNSIYANRVKFAHFVAKRTATNPARGPFHEKTPAVMFKRAVRGMIPRKTIRGQNALHRLKVYEGIPAPYDKMKRMVVPQALRVLRLRPGRKYTNIGELCTVLGWKHGEVLKTLEAKRKAKSAAYHTKKMEEVKAVKDATASVKTDPILTTFGM
jgi:large subunit ribosomal protein L13Ae